MNQPNRQLLKKCIQCGRNICVPQVYDKHYSEYTDVRIPICFHCDPTIGLFTYDVSNEDQEDDQVTSS